MNLFLTCALAIWVARPAIELKGVNPGNVIKPVVVDLPVDGFKPSVEHYELRIAGDRNSRPVPMQIIDDYQKAVFVLPPDVSGDVTLEIFNAPLNTGGFTIQQTETGLHFTEEDRPVITYNYGTMSKEGVPEDRNRSGYFHPVYGLEGEIITDDFPGDHYHHRGLYWSWPHVMVDGNSYDIWHMRGIKPRFIEWLYQEAGQVCARFGTNNGWFTQNGKVVDERVDFTLYQAGENGQAIDIRLEFHAVKHTVRISGQTTDNKGYGGFLYRPAPRTRENTFLTSNTGPQRRDSDLDEFTWGDFSAQWGQGNITSGLSIFSNPLNPKHPPGWIFRYYGYLGVSWPGLEFYTLEPGGEPLILHYRVWIHKGNAEAGKSAQAYSAYDQPYESVTFRSQ